MPLPDNFSATVPASKKKYDLIPEGVYQVEIEDINLKEEISPWSNEMETKISFQMTILTDEPFEGDINGSQSTRGRRIWKDVTNKMSPGGNVQPSNLYVIATSVLKKDLSWEECKKFNPSSLIGQQLRIGVKHRRSSTGNTSARIESYYKPNKPLPSYDYELERADREADSPLA